MDDEKDEREGAADEVEEQHLQRGREDADESRDDDDDDDGDVEEQRIKLIR